MQQAVERHNRAGKEPLSVRIGISTGEATEDDGDYFGDPVVEAARLCSVAEGGQILAADLVRLLVGRHATQTFVELGALDLKGLPEPVPAVEVQWEPESVAGSVPLPPRLVGVASDALFGFFLDAIATTGQREYAQTVVDHVAPFSRQVLIATTAIIQGAVARPLGRAATLLGDYDRAEEWFAAAHDIHQRLRAPYWSALGRLHHADLCLTRRGDGDVDRARELITTAAATAAEHTLPGLTRRADALLAEL